MAFWAEGFWAEGFYVADFWAGDAEPGGLTPGFASASAGNERVSLSASAPSGGTAPYTYQWYRSTDGGKGDAIVGATSLTYSDTDVDNGTTYYYTLDVTDDAAATESYAQVTATPREETFSRRRRMSWMR